jgi:D-amino-acid oxidase
VTPSVTPSVTRRHAILGVAALGYGCAARKRPQLARAPGLPALAPVNVAADRVIRTVAGLRPYRPSGFVVKAETLGRKTVVHNYGHGGAGITMSWGTAYLAVELAAGAATSECAVLGSGVVGLSTARLLQQRGFAVTIYAKDLPPNTTSNVAGGLWKPVSLFDSAIAPPGFQDQFVRAARFSHRYFQGFVGDDYGVRWIPLYSLDEEDVDPLSHSLRPIADLFPEAKSLNRAEYPFPTAHAFRCWTMLIEPPVYLNALMRDFQIAGGRIVVRDFENAESIASLKESVIVNCTGLGAGTLFGDSELVPIKGQLAFLLPQPEVNYCTIGPGDLYMFPRRDGILLGGTHEQGVWTLDPDPAETDRIVQGNRDLFEKMRS